MSYIRIHMSSFSIFSICLSFLLILNWKGPLSVKLTIIDTGTLILTYQNQFNFKYLLSIQINNSGKSKSYLKTARYDNKYHLLKNSFKQYQFVFIISLVWSFSFHLIFLHDFFLQASNETDT